MNERFLFIGGDKRMQSALEVISQRFPCGSLGTTLADSAEGRYGRIVLPLPLTRDGESINAPFSERKLPFSLIGEYAERGAVVFSGGSSPLLSELCEQRGLRLVDYFADEPLTLKNAALTAEAAAAILSQCTDGSLFGARVLITGYGRCARYAARLIKAFGAEVIICARSAQQRAAAQLDGFYALTAENIPLSGADFVVNTVPARLFGERDIAAMQEGAVYMELATLPPEPLKALCESRGVRYIHAAGLPGKCSPKTAGGLIAQTILAAL